MCLEAHTLLGASSSKTTRKTWLLVWQENLTRWVWIWPPKLQQPASTLRRIHNCCKLHWVGGSQDSSAYPTVLGRREPDTSAYATVLEDLKIQMRLWFSKCDANACNRDRDSSGGPEDTNAFMVLNACSRDDNRAAHELAKLISLTWMSPGWDVDVRRWPELF